MTLRTGQVGAVMTESGSTYVLYEPTPGYRVATPRVRRTTDPMDLLFEMVLAPRVGNRMMLVHGNGIQRETSPVARVIYLAGVQERYGWGRTTETK